MNLHTIGALLAVVIPPLFVICFLKITFKLRIIISILCLCCTMVLFLSDSGSGWLAFIVSITFILLCWRRWLAWVLLTVEGMTAIAAVIYYDQTHWLKATFSTSSLNSRITLWQNTFELLKGKAAVLGLGPGAWLRVYSSHYTIIAAIVENSYLQLYCDAGILGFVAMVLAAIIFVRYVINLLKSNPRNSQTWIGIGLVASIIAGAVFAIFDTTHSITYVTDKGYIYLALPLLWIGAALISVMENKLSTH